MNDITARWAAEVRREFPEVQVHKLPGYDCGDCEFPAKVAWMGKNGAGEWRYAMDRDKARGYGCESIPPRVAVLQVYLPGIGWVRTQYNSKGFDIPSSFRLNIETGDVVTPFQTIAGKR